MSIKERVLIFITFFIVLMVFVAMFFAFILPSRDSELNRVVYKKIPKIVSLDVVTFKNKQDFAEYLDKSSDVSVYNTGDLFIRTMPSVEALDVSFQGGAKMISSQEGIEDGSQYFSQTNVRTQGIDEPDIVKTDGKNIYFSYQIFNSYPAIPEPAPLEIETKDRFQETGKLTLPYPYFSKNRIGIIKALPPDDMDLESIIEDGDRIMTVDNILVVVNNKYLRAYDLSSLNNDKINRIWEFKADKNTYVDKVRNINNKLYVATRSSIDRSNPCPIAPLKFNQSEIVIPCEKIYHPINILPVSDVYSIFEIDSVTGKSVRSLSFVGMRNNFIYYMTKDNIYITYEDRLNIVEIVKKFVLQSKVFGDDIKNKILKVASYDISERAKMIEYEDLFRKYIEEMDIDSKEKLTTELSNEWSEYVKSNKAGVQKTTIVQIGTGVLKIKRTGSLPGRILNEFSIDEHDGYVRTAVTFDYNRIGVWPYLQANTVSENGIYILDKNLNIIGRLDGLGLTERIYSARFIGDKAYVVTFRRVDPFYVIDLSNPYRPYKAGELKIPGYSSYLHPLDKNLIVGIGKEGARVKVSLFDVSDPTDPQEVDKYILSSAYWSDILNTHRAFLLDKRFKVFFVPAGKAVYVFSYKDKKLDLVKSIVVNTPKRALYIDKYAYIVGRNQIIAVDEEKWDRVGEIDLSL